LQPTERKLTLQNTHAELLNASWELTQAIDMNERAPDELVDDYHEATPRQIKADHAERLLETYDEPLAYLAVDLPEASRREWLHAKPETNGAAEVERHGLTSNQRQC